MEDDKSAGPVRRKSRDDISERKVKTNVNERKKTNNIKVKGDFKALEKEEECISGDNK